ncbi:pyridoxal kinase PdxY [Bosea sp. (in: a-proteobacteria)]|uniref:pyridoxal kinase PdxY n=1 Tax=Bosea sp. (in: a-proteobacteria) TaxID=1871050 RepID=UPI0026233A55|nr:pyridoxal kinase PdxY [Bosea sp. (in: a-proteobacteria)]MCO5091957.1 pyridoxal kinase PdxY [Bosea sp. (in: a-proteobacteria)]
MNILSIQSHVAYGHVGNASATFPMQRLGVEVWPIHTVQFSNHTGYGNWKGRVFDGGMIDEVMEGIAERGALTTCDGVLSGYMGSADIGHAILSAVERVRAANPKALYCCDPVIGDVGRGVFVRPGIPEFMREQAVPAADIVTPNQFELELLTDVAITTLSDAHRAVEALRDAGPKVAMVTSLKTEETPAEAIDLMAADATGSWRVRTPRLDVDINGAGDAIAALFFTHYLREESAAAALSKAASSVYGLLKRTKESGSREILTVAAQDEFVAPSQVFAPEAL